MSAARLNAAAGVGMALVGGYVDVVGFVLLFGLFVNHATGNLVMLGVSLAGGGQGIGHLSGHRNGDRRRAANLDFALRVQDHRLDLVAEAAHHARRHQHQRHAEPDARDRDDREERQPPARREKLLKG